jgi:type IV pilus biogenesis protein CpaD/CtpE
MIIKNNISTSALIGVALTGFLAGCATAPRQVEKDFGSSVRGMNQAQILDPVAARNPDMTPVMTTDGQRMETVMGIYRSSVGEPQSVFESTEISIAED